MASPVGEHVIQVSTLQSPKEDESQPLYTLRNSPEHRAPGGTHLWRPLPFRVEVMLESPLLTSPPLPPGFPVPFFVYLPLPGPSLLGVREMLSWI